MTTHDARTWSGSTCPVRVKPEEVLQLDCEHVVVRSYVGVLVKSFERRAA